MYTSCLIKFLSDVLLAFFILFPSDSISPKHQLLQVQALLISKVKLDYKTLICT
ncbi:hypothetical protein ACB092_12G141000 [Castanea dentata]